MSPEQLIGRGILGDDLFVAAPNGRRLRAMIAGSGEDLVVLEGGLGVSGLYWGPVHALVAQRVHFTAFAQFIGIMVQRLLDLESELDLSPRHLLR